MPKDIEREEVQRLVAAGAQLVDVLPPSEYAEDHLPGALSLPLRKIDLEAKTTLDPSRPVIVYCWDSA
ncbi:MAG: rhodanese-like domain-containing protein [Actinomycetota bacterium]